MSSQEDLLLLRWNNFESNIKSGFSEIRSDEDFFDVTLACDSKQIKAHKVILSACSPFFRALLKSIPHQHPLLYLRGIQATHLESLLCFIYNGEVSVTHEELDSLLGLAEEFQIKGFTPIFSNESEPPAKRTRQSKRNASAAAKQSFGFEEADELQLDIVSHIIKEEELSTASDPIGISVIQHSEDYADHLIEDNYFVAPPEDDNYIPHPEVLGLNNTDNEEGSSMAMECNESESKMTLMDSLKPETWFPVRKNGTKNIEFWAMFDVNERGTKYKCMACKKILKASSSPNGVKKHLEICMRGAFYKSGDKLLYAASARQSDLL